MELLSGNTLDDLLEVRLTPFPEEEAIDVFQQAAAGLAHAHGQLVPVIHRDIKLGNIHLDLSSGQVRILDFGIAKAATSHTVTQTGMARCLYGPGAFHGHRRACAHL